MPPSERAGREARRRPSRSRRKPAPFEIQGVARGRPDRLHAGAAQARRSSIVARVRPRPAVHAADRERGTHPDAGRRPAARTGRAPRSIPRPACSTSRPIACPSSSRCASPRPCERRYDYIGEFRYLAGPRGLPLLKPPYGSMVAIDMNTGEHRWRIPVGRSTAIPAIAQLGIRERLGLPLRSWALVTKTVMMVVQMGYYGAPRLMRRSRSPDQRPGQPRPAALGVRQGHRRMLAEIPLPANATGSPISYMAGGKQYIVFPVGGGPLGRRADRGCSLTGSRRKSSDQLIPWTENTEISNITRTSPAFA